jgi:hypothetical protein
MVSCCIHSGSFSQVNSSLSLKGEKTRRFQKKKRQGKKRGKPCAMTNRTACSCPTQMRAFEQWMKSDEHSTCDNFQGDVILKENETKKLANLMTREWLPALQVAANFRLLSTKTPFAFKQADTSSVTSEQTKINKPFLLVFRLTCFSVRQKSGQRVSMQDGLCHHQHVLNVSKRLRSVLERNCANLTEKKKSNKP